MVISVFERAAKIGINKRTILLQILGINKYVEKQTLPHAAIGI